MLYHGAPLRMYSPMDRIQMLCPGAQLRMYSPAMAMSSQFRQIPTLYQSAQLRK